VKILFDTNVLIAAFATRGVCKDLFEYCLTEHAICISQWIFKEFSQKLVTKFGFPQDKVDQAVTFMQDNLIKTTAASLSSPVCRDADDDHVLAAAVGGGVDCLITGDEDLLVLREFQGIPILRPADFWRFEKERNKQHRT
jgi:putative PIN family toxin of toxin-antitoxin system